MQDVWLAAEYPHPHTAGVQAPLPGELARLVGTVSHGQATLTSRAAQLVQPSRNQRWPEAAMPGLHVFACSFLLFTMGCQAHQLIPGTPLQVLSCLTKPCTWQELAMQYTTKCLDMLISS